jgi:hypothetical protein
MAKADLLIHKIARARRFADAVGSDADREMLKPWPPNCSVS